METVFAFLRPSLSIWAASRGTSGNLSPFLHVEHGVVGQRDRPREGDGDRDGGSTNDET